VRIADVDRLVAGVAHQPDVRGVVLLGSAADTARADEWSDVDLWLVVAEGAQERYREDLSWLPGHEDIAVVARETEHGRAVVFGDGSYVELAVASPADLTVFRATQARVVLDRGGVAEAVAAITVAPPGPDREPARRALAMLCGRLLVGVGRARRGELVSAGRFVRELAVGEVLVALRLLRPPADEAALDPLDPTRRVERAYPVHAGALAAACREDVEPCARRLLDLAERWFAGEPEWPSAGVAAVRRRLGWDDPAPR
jgi:predicted nucleotidyltransferase